MMYKFIAAVFLLLLWRECSAQTGGLLVSDERYQTVPVLPVYSGVKYTEIPVRVSLKKYCPVPGDQRKSGACAGWAAGYGALTIQRAILSRITDQAVITQQAHSAAYIYNQVKNRTADCSEGAYLEDALTTLKEQGDCLEKTFAFEKNDCHSMPGAAERAEAQQYRIQDFAAVFTLDESPKTKIGKVCKILATNTPIIVGIGVSKSFFEILPGATTWDPAPDEAITGYHAMVLTGYNNVEKYVECFNSFGASWGQNGFIRIPYTDFERLCRYGFVLVPGAAAPQPPDEHRFLSGAFAFRQPAGFVTNGDGEELVYFEEVNTKLAEPGFYKTEKPVFEVGDAFQLVAREIPAGRYAYVFSQDASGEINLHFPRKTDGVASAGFVLDKRAEIVIPEEESLLQLSMPGNDFLCILYANTPVTDFEKRLGKLTSITGSFPQKVDKIFSDILITAPNVQFSADKMSFTAIADPPGGRMAVAIILVVAAQ